MMIRLRLYMVRIWFLSVTVFFGFISVNTASILVDNEDMTIDKLLRVDGWLFRLNSVVREIIIDLLSKMVCG